jgi:hypothetical protein
LADALAERGSTAHAVELANDPALHAADFADLVRRQVPSVDAPIVLAHSGSGPLLPAAARAVRASRQVWLAAWVPDPDVPFVDDVKANIGEAFDPGWIGVDPIEDDAVAETFLYHDCDAETLRWALSTRRAFVPRGAYEERVPLAAEIPSTYIVATEDRTIQPDWQRRMARERLNVEPVEIPTGHCPNVSRPDLLAEILLGVASEQTSHAR